MTRPTITVTHSPDPRRRQQLNALIDQVIARAPKPTPQPTPKKAS